MSHLSIDRRVSSECVKEYIQSVGYVTLIHQIYFLIFLFYSLQQQPMELSPGKYCFFIVVPSSLNV